MVYRDLGNTGVRLSPLGFGMMRLPSDERVVIKMVRDAIDAGVNYIDTAYGYLDGKSESITGRVLSDGYRDKIYLATKCPVWLIEKDTDFDRILNEQLKRLKTEQIDFYLLHSLNKNNWERVKKFGLLEKMKEAREQGKICYLGFSFHDTYDLFQEIVDSFEEWDFCQIQLNYLDTKYQAGIKGMKYAAEKGLGIIVMEPLRGGYLANVPQTVQDIFGKNKSPIEWSFDFLWDMPEVGTVLSGMSTQEQVEQNVKYAERSSVGMLSEDDKKVIEAVTKEFKKMGTVPCTGCSYCNICPQKIAIPQSFAAYNSALLEDNFEQSKHQYVDWVPRFGALPSNCISCHKCEEICPQHIKISEYMHKIHEFFQE